MLHVTVDNDTRIVVLEPEGALSKSDFERASETVDPLIDTGGALHGIIVHTESFPGWDSFAALISHLRFVKDHHRDIERLALVTDASVRDIGASIAAHFVAAEIKAFPFADIEDARQWIRDGVDQQ